MVEFQTASEKTSFPLNITGDTLIIKQLREITQQYSSSAVSWRNQSIRVLVTMDGKQRVEATQFISPPIAIPIHYNGYKVFKSPLDDFRQEITAAALEKRVRYLSHGDTYNFEVPVCRC